ncbi:hypothetical protein KM043_017991 [Ampulex compressa]|nr:hypothetical protein KM043_017991 [Ampulex compressa]
MVLLTGTKKRGGSFDEVQRGLMRPNPEHRGGWADVLGRRYFIDLERPRAQRRRPKKMKRGRGVPTVSSRSRPSANLDAHSSIRDSRTAGCASRSRFRAPSVVHFGSPVEEESALGDFGISSQWPRVDTRPSVRPRFASPFEDRRRIPLS